VLVVLPPGAYRPQRLPRLVRLGDMSDDDARALCRKFADAGEAAFLIRTNGEDGIRVIGPDLPGKTVAAMLREAAAEFDARAEDEVLH
jgi:hypothetical protein